MGDRKNGPQIKMWVSLAVSQHNHVYNIYAKMGEPCIKLDLCFIIIIDTPLNTQGPGNLLLFIYIHDRDIQKNAVIHS